MKKTTTVVVLVLGLLLLSIGCNSNPVELETESGNEKSIMSNEDDYGRPFKIDIVPVPDDERNVKFGLIGDSHIDASYAGWVFGHPYRDTDRVKRNRNLIHDINIDATSAGCLGIIHLGDMVDDNNNQNLVAFRQLYENDYPGHDGGAIAGVSDEDYDAYSQGYRINKPVFPTLGNHDVPYYDDDPHNWSEPANYINDRVIGASGLKYHYRFAAYIWRWGQYYFINLGLWAGSYEHESNTDIDYGKLQWLEAFLSEHVGNSNLGVLIFQHYGWDDFSTDGRWWSNQMRNLQLDVLMRRPLGSGNTVQGNPYNVIGIFTGHTHDVEQISVFAGQDTLGNDVHFDNIVVNNAGADIDYGFSIVYLFSDEMRVKTKDCHNNKWSHWTKPIHTGP